MTSGRDWPARRRRRYWFTVGHAVVSLVALPLAVLAFDLSPALGAVVLLGALTIQMPLGFGPVLVVVLLTSGARGESLPNWVLGALLLASVWVNSTLWAGLWVRWWEGRFGSERVEF